MYKQILIATDGSPLSMSAVEHGVDLAKSLNAKVIFLTAVEKFHLFSADADQLEYTPEEFKEHGRRRAEASLAEAEEVANRAEVTCESTYIEDDQPYEAIVRVAQARHCDLIVMASHGRRGISALLLGSETMKVLTHSPLPVLVVRSKDQEEQPAQP